MVVVVFEVVCVAVVIVDVVVVVVVVVVAVGGLCVKTTVEVTEMNIIITS